MFSHDVYTGKCNRGLMGVGSLRHLVQDRTLSQDEEKKALILGWCIEWVRITYIPDDCSSIHFSIFCTSSISSSLPSFLILPSDRKSVV